jgi:DMSO/TMAO reductase YedYZ molybdopterin-dependent catalytic subunit
MKAKQIISGALVGGLLTLPLMALQYLADQLYGLVFVPFDVFDWMAGLLPGSVITFGIDAMIDMLRLLGFNVANTAKIAEQLMAVGQYLVLGIAAGGVYFIILYWQKIRPSLIAGVVVGALFGFPAVAISIALGDSKVHPLINFIWLMLLYLIWGVALIGIYGKVLRYEASTGTHTADQSHLRGVEKLNRRQFVVMLGTGAATITVVGTGLGQWLSRREKGSTGEAMAHQTEGPDGDPFPNMDDMVLPAPGTRPEYTPIKDHYQVFIELEPTEIDGATWKLPITGMVTNPLMLSLDDIRNNYSPRDQYVTLSCISGRIGTTLISTTYWTGISVQEVLTDAGVQENARYLHIEAGDGFYETVLLDLIESDPRIMLCYAWDGNVLPVGHGFPLRIWIPDRYGMKQPKWITSIQVSDTYKEGYWVSRNWGEVAQVKTTSVIDTVAVDHIVEKSGQMYIPVGGIAFSGDRGISKVEIRVNNSTWEEAQLRSPLSETAWVIWRYEWPFKIGDHTFEVRCYDGDGVLQELESGSARPDGATGIHSSEKAIA